MSPRAKIITAAVVAFGLGATSGVVAGFWQGTKFAVSAYGSALTANGTQALLVLEFLDRNKEAELKVFMESEIDATLEGLRAMEPREGYAHDDLDGRLYENVKAYRAAHPKKPGAKTIEGK
jgi:hypothetical protein